MAWPRPPEAWPRPLAPGQKSSGQASSKSSGQFDFGLAQAISKFRPIAPRERFRPGQFEKFRPVRFPPGPGRCSRQKIHVIHTFELFEFIEILQIVELFELFEIYEYLEFL